MTLDDVLTEVFSARPVDSGSGPWTMRDLQTIDRQCHGRWHKASVPLSDCGRFVLSWHAGEPCHGDTRELVPGPGATVAGTVRRLEADRVGFGQANPSCWSRISQAMTAPMSTVVVSSVPVHRPGEPCPACLDGDRTLYVVDGLHRLVAWFLAGRQHADDVVPLLIAGILDA